MVKSKIVGIIAGDIPHPCLHTHTHTQTHARSFFIILHINVVPVYNK